MSPPLASSGWPEGGCFDEETLKRKHLSVCLKRIAGPTGEAVQTKRPVPTKRSPLEQPHDLHRVRQRVSGRPPRHPRRCRPRRRARRRQICRCGVQLERVASPSTLPPPPMLLTSSQPMPPLLPPSSPALSRFLLLMCSCLLRCVQLMALSRRLVGRFRPLCTNRYNPQGLRWAPLF